ncbi:MAG TPA: MotA/TolQ/ExbB proton channel family protein [Burkholderiales bacterium]
MKNIWPKLKRSMGTSALAMVVGLAALLPAPASAQAPKDAAAPPSSAAPAPAAPAPAVPQAIEEGRPRTVVENPYGIEALWKQGDFVSRGTLIILVIMSIGSWYIGIVKLIEQARLLKDAREADQKFWAAKGVQAGVEALRSDSAFRFISEEGLIAVKDHSAMPKQQIDLNSWLAMTLDRAIDVVNNRLQTGLAFLATVGSTAPFVGLFGTVWGIYHALTAIGIAGQASIDKVAGPVGEALIMTALGLAVAVPAVLGYNWLVRRNRVAMEHVRRFGSSVQMTLLGGGHTPHKAA